MAASITESVKSKELQRFYAGVLTGAGAVVTIGVAAGGAPLAAIIGVLAFTVLAGVGTYYCHRQLTQLLNSQEYVLIQMRNQLTNEECSLSTLLGTKNSLDEVTGDVTMALHYMRTIGYIPVRKDRRPVESSAIKTVENYASVCAPRENRNRVFKKYEDETADEYIQLVKGLAGDAHKAFAES